MKLVIPANVPILQNSQIGTSPKSWGSLTPSPVPISKISFYGDDSIWGANPNSPSTKTTTPYPDRLNAELSYTVSNEGTLGGTAAKLLNGTDGIHAAWNTIVNSADFQSAIFSFCIKDASSGTSVSSYKQDLRNLIDPALQKGIRVFLETPHETTASVVDIGAYEFSTGLSGEPARPSATIYVATTGNDTTGNGSQGAPYATISKAASVAVAGSVIEVASGNYNGGFTTSASGTSTNPIIYRSASLHGAKIVHPASSASDTSWHQTGNNVYIEDFEVNGTYSGSGTRYRLGIHIQATGCLVRRNFVHDFWTDSGLGSPGGGGAGILLNGQDGDTACEAVSNWIQSIGHTSSNQIHGIYISQRNSHAKNNVISDIGAYAIHLYHDILSNEIVNNTVFNSYNGVIVGEGGYYVTSAPFGAVVHNNIFYDIENIAIREYEDTAGKLGNSHSYRNNCLFNNGANSLMLQGSLINSVLSDPLFVDYQADGNGNYALQSGSPCRNAGYSLYAPNTDYTTGGRTFSSPVDAFRVALSEIATEKSVHLIDTHTFIKNYRRQNRLTLQSLYPFGTIPKQGTYDLIAENTKQYLLSVLGEGSQTPSPGPTPTPTPTPTPSGDRFIEIVAAQNSHATLLSTNSFVNIPKSIKFTLTVLSASNAETDYPYIIFSSDSAGNIENSRGVRLKQDKIVYRDVSVDRYTSNIGIPLNTTSTVEIVQASGAPLRVFIDNGLVLEASISVGTEGYLGFGAVGCTVRIDNLSGTISDNFNSYSVGSKSVNTILGSLKVIASGGVGGSVSINEIVSTTPSPTPAPAGVTQAPSNGATLSGVVNLSISGENIYNAELLPEFGYTPIYGTFNIASDHRSASLAWDTRNVSDRTQKFRISTYDQPPGTVGAVETVVMPARSWTIANNTSTGVLPAHVVEYHGTSFVWGYSGGGEYPEGQRVPNPIPNFLKNKFSQLTVRNEGVNSSNSTKLLNGTDGVHTNWSNYVANNNANVYIMQFGFSESADLTIAQWKNNLTQLFNIANSAGKKVIFVSIHKNLIYDVSAHAIAMQEVAQQLGAGYIDNYTYTSQNFTGSLNSWMPDNYHLTQAGYQLVGENIANLYQNLYNNLTGSAPAPSPSPSPSGIPAMRGPNASSFNSTPTFFDDFDGTTLSNKWNRGLWYSAARPNTFRVNGGCLELCAQSDTMFTGQNETAYSVMDTDPSSGRGASPGFVQRYGVFQIEAKLSAGKGMWPSFWLYQHANNSDRPEIDIFEAYPGGQFDWTTGSNPPRPSRADVAVHALNENSGNIAPTASFNMTNSGLDLSADFHTYTLEWDSTYMRFYFDGNLAGTVTDTGLLNFINQYQMYILLGLGINYGVSGGPSSDPSITPTGFGTDPNNVPNNVYRIKYCAVWQWSKYL